MVDRHAQETRALAEYLVAVAVFPDDERLREDLAKARSAVETAWLEQTLMMEGSDG